jgi:hypothetical protein
MMAFGVALARKSAISRRIERLLNEGAFRQVFDGRRGALVAVLLIPAALFTVAVLVRAQAAAQTQSGGAAAEEVAPAQTALKGAQAPAEQDASQAAAPDSEPSFDRTFSVAGQLDLSVVTVSGHIHLSRSSGGRIRIHGAIKSDHAGNEQQIRQIEANPPIDQDGNSVRVGGRKESLHEITIDYEIEAPDDAAVRANTVSGDIVDEGVGENAKLTTVSGNVQATGMHGGFSILTASGDVKAEDSGEGDTKIQTGSGDIEIKNARGSLKAQTGSGDIKLTGTPAAPWTVRAGSGDVEFWPGDAALTLDATVGTGKITCDRAPAFQTSSSAHHLAGQLNGGGPAVSIESGSGDVRVH